MLGESEEGVKVVAATSATATGTGKRWEEVARPTRDGGVATKGKEKEKMNEPRKETKKAPPRPRSPTRSPSPVSPEMKNARVPKRRLSVVVPFVSKEYFSSQGVRDMDGDRERERGKRGSSGCDLGDEMQAALAYGVKPQPHAKAKPKLSASKEKAKARAHDSEDVGEEDDRSMVIDVPMTSTRRGCPR